MKYYKHWSPKTRRKNLYLFNKAKKAGKYPKPEQCKFCGQKEGILHTHCEDYDVSLKLLPLLIIGSINDEEKDQLKEALWDICWRCHMMWHTNPSGKRDKYFEEIKNGKQYPPVFRHNYKIIVDEHLSK